MEERLAKIIELASNPDFIKTAVKYARLNGISAEEWNENKSGILFMLASEMLSKLDK